MAISVFRVKLNVEFTSQEMDFLKVLCIVLRIGVCVWVDEILFILRRHEEQLCILNYAVVTFSVFYYYLF